MRPTARIPNHLQCSPKRAEPNQGLEVNELEGDAGLRAWHEANRHKPEDRDYGWETTEPAALEMLP